MGEQWCYGKLISVRRRNLKGSNVSFFGSFFSSLKAPWILSQSFNLPLQTEILLASQFMIFWSKSSPPRCTSPLVAFFTSIRPSPSSRTWDIQIVTTTQASITLAFSCLDSCCPYHKANGCCSRLMMIRFTSRTCDFLAQLLWLLDVLHHWNMLWLLLITCFSYRAARKFLCSTLHFWRIMPEVPCACKIGPYFLTATVSWGLFLLLKACFFSSRWFPKNFLPMIASQMNGYFED